jgi:hypothetical protein
LNQVNTRASARRKRQGRAPGISAEHRQQLRRVRAMPKEVAVLLIVSGIGGILLPGPVGTPFLILGGLMLWPKAFHKLGFCLEHWFPRMHRHGVNQINRFLDDLEKRYPLDK